jgi:hypothetical protein
VVDGCGIWVCGMGGCDMVCVVVDIVGVGVVGKGFWVGVDWGGGGVVLGGGVVGVVVCVLVGGFCDVLLVVVVPQCLLPSKFLTKLGLLSSRARFCFHSLSPFSSSS